jgi:mRNA degradation ribonuclease J1/J2
VFVKSQDQLIDKIEQIVKLKIAEYKDDWKHNKVVSVISKELSKTLRAEIKKVPLMVIQIKEI